MKLSDFDFDLPDDLIATRPASPRSAARLLVVRAGAQAAPSLHDAQVLDLPAFLQAGDRLVFNDTRVLPARLTGVRRRAGGGDVAVEVTLMRPTPEGRWEVMARPLRRLAPGDRLSFGGDLGAEVIARAADRAVIGFDVTGPDFDTALARVGTMPLPPYIASRRPADARDNEDYQTVFAMRPGAVAAPTAALHFDATLLAALDRAGIARSTVTLHVGAGTFLPVKVEDIERHHMHSEWGEVTDAAAAEINATRAAGGRIIPVGTTCLRLLESAAASDGTLRHWRGETDIFIRPGYRFRIADGLMTNFHLPKSTLMMLVSALIGRDAVMAAYAHAVAARYRFFSYGDSSLLLPAPSP